VQPPSAAERARERTPESGKNDPCGPSPSPLPSSRILPFAILI